MTIDTRVCIHQDEMSHKTADGEPRDAVSTHQDLNSQTQVGGKTSLIIIFGLHSKDILGYRKSSQVIHHPPKH